LAYRICKSFEVESGHMLSKHPGLCRHPHGHSRTVEVVIAANTLDAGDMVCDFKTIKLALNEHLASLDHALAMNSADPLLKQMDAKTQRIVVYENADPTTEVMAERIFRFLQSELAGGRVYTDDRGDQYRFPPGLRLERVRVSETSSTWAEFDGR
jgi:6-pyruvoyltetrahydropterin/6-carboxytetrahydropterin synthase